MAATIGIRYGSLPQSGVFNMNVVDLELGRNFYRKPAPHAQTFLRVQRSLEQTTDECPVLIGVDATVPASCCSARCDK